MNGPVAKLLDPGVAAPSRAPAKRSCSTVCPCFKKVAPPMGKGPGPRRAARFWHPPAQPRGQPHCVLCLTCAQACPASLRALRPEGLPPADLQRENGATAGEAGDPGAGGGGVLPEVSGAAVGGWALAPEPSPGSSDRCCPRLGPLGCLAPGPAVRCLVPGAALLAPRCRLLPLYASRPAAGALWLVCPCSGPCCWPGPIFRSHGGGGVVVAVEPGLGVARPLAPAGAPDPHT